MRKICNYRFFPILSGSLTLFSLPAVFMAKSWLFVLGAFATAVIIFSVFIKDKRLRVTAIIVPIISVVTMTLAYFALQKDAMRTDVSDVRLELTVQKVSVDKSEVYGTAVDVVTGEKYDGVYFQNDYLFNSTEEVRAGDVIRLKADMTAIRFRENVVNSRYLRGVRYGLDNLEFYSANGGGKISFPLVVRQYMVDCVNKYGVDERGIAGALLFGDKTMISDEVGDDFRSAGLAHVLAISGLHFSVISGILILALSLLPIGNTLRTLIRFAVMLLYTAVCGFTPSTVRAFIMISVYDLSILTERKYDPLSSLCFASSLTIIFNPIVIADVGYLMSYTAIFGILTLARPLKRMFCKLPDKVGDFLSVSLSVNVALFPVMAEYFGTVSIVFLLTNAVVLPLMSFGYVFLLLSLTPGFLSAVPRFLAEKFIDLITWVSSLSFGSLEVNKIGVIGIILFCAVIVYASDFIFKTPKKSNT